MLFSFISELGLDEFYVLEAAKLEFVLLFPELVTFVLMQS